MTRSARSVLHARRIIAEVQRFNAAERDAIYATALSQQAANAGLCPMCGNPLSDDYHRYCSIQCDISAEADEPRCIWCSEPLPNEDHAPYCGNSCAVRAEHD